MAKILFLFFSSPINIGMIVLCTIVTILLWRKANKTGSIQLRNYCSTLWTSVGILGTFLSIYISLNGMDFTSTSGNAIENLIQNIIPAFSTSIIGIVGAIVCTIWNRLSIAESEEIEENDFKSTKNKCGVRNESNSPELILLEIVKSINDSCASTNNTLNGSKQNSDTRLKQLIERLGAVSTMLSENHTQTTNTITTALEQQKNNFLSAIDVMSSKFETAMSTTQQDFKEEIRTLSANLEGKVQFMITSNKEILAETLKLQKQELDLVSTTLKKESEERTKNLQEFVGTQNKEFTALYSKIDEQISSHIEAEKTLFQKDIKSAIEEFAKAQYATCIDSIKESNNALVQSSRELIEKQEVVNESFVTNLSGKLTTTCDNLVNTVSQLSTDMANRLQKIHDDEATLIETTISNNTNDVRSLLDTNKKEIEKVSTAIKNDYDHLISELSASYNKMKEDYLEIAKDFNGSIVTANAGVKSQIGEISTTIVGIQQTISSSLDDLQSDVIKAMKDFEKQNEALKEHIKDNNKDLSENIAKQIEDAFSIHALEQACGRLNTTITNTIENIQGKLSIISSKLEETGESVSKSASLYSGAVDKSSEINAYIEKTVDVFKLHKNALDNMQNSLTNMEQAVNRLRDQWHDISLQKVTRQSTNIPSRTKK